MLIAFLKSPIVIILTTQVLFTISDLIGRANMRHSPFAVSTFISWWFLIYCAIRQIAMFGQLYLFATLPVGKTMAMFGASSIVIVNVLGFLLLGEVLSLRAYAGVAVAVAAFLILAVSH